MFTSDKEVDLPVVYMLVGVPGSGKSTWTRIQMKKNSYLSYVSTDAYIEDWAQEQGKTYNQVFSDLAKQATHCMYEDVELLTRNEGSFIWDQTNINAKTRKAKLAKIPSHYKKVAVVFNTSLVDCIKRNAARDRSIPERIIVSMHESFEMPNIEEGFDKVIVY